MLYASIKTYIEKKDVVRSERKKGENGQKGFQL